MRGRGRWRPGEKGMKRVMAGLVVVLALGGCKGWLGNGSPLFDPGDTQDETAEGRWSGSTTAGSVQRTTDMLILPDGFAWTAIYEQAYGYGELMTGQLTLDQAEVTSSSRHYTHEGQGFFTEDGTATLDGDVDGGSRLNYALTTRVNSVNSSYSVSLGYDSGYDQDAGLATLAGQYRVTADNVGTQTFTIDSDGVIEGENGSCTVSGQALVQDAEHNLYTVTLNFGSSCAHTGVMTGRAALDYAAGVKTGLTLFARPDSGALAFLFRGTLP